MQGSRRAGSRADSYPVGVAGRKVGGLRRGGGEGVSST